MNRWLRVPKPSRDGLPERVGDDDVRYSEELVRAFLTEHTEPGDRVLDPFAGYGTTLAVARDMGRRSIGIEILPERAEMMRDQLGPGPTVLTGDARRLGDLDIGPIDFVMTSPPYMTQNEHPQDPLSGYTALGAEYTRYLGELQDIFRQVADLLVPAGRVVINAANPRQSGVTTHLAWDIARVVSDVLAFEREIIVINEEMPADVLQDYCLVFSRPGTAA